MIYWKLLNFTEAKNIWDDNLRKFDDCNVQQSFAWGEFRRQFGWEPYRWVALDSKKNIIALFQAGVRKYLGGGVVIGKGGPIGLTKVWGQELHRAILFDLQLKFCYCRIFPKRQHDPKDILYLKNNNWHKPFVSNHTDLSMFLDLTKDKEQLLKNCSRNWRRNLQRSLKRDLIIQHWQNIDVDEMFFLYKEMESYKELKQQFSKKEIEELLKAFQDNIILYKCFNQKGKILSLRGCVSIGHTAMDLFAASNEEGRKEYASYGVFWQLLQHCQKQGVKYYDLNAIDPVGNPGVYNFKKGTGANLLKYLGEWEYFSHPSLKIPFNLCLYLKNKL